MCVYTCAVCVMAGVERVIAAPLVLVSTGSKREKNRHESIHTCCIQSALQLSPADGRDEAFFEFYYIRWRKTFTVFS